MLGETWICNWKLSCWRKKKVTTSKLAVRKCSNWRLSELEASVLSHHYVNCFSLLLLHPEVRQDPSRKRSVADTPLAEHKCQEGQLRLTRYDRQQERDINQRSCRESRGPCKDIWCQLCLKHVQHGYALGGFNAGRDSECFKNIIYPAAKSVLSSGPSSAPPDSSSCSKLQQVCGGDLLRVTEQGGATFKAFSPALCSYAPHRSWIGLVGDLGETHQICLGL